MYTCDLHTHARIFWDFIYLPIFVSRLANQQAPFINAIIIDKPLPIHTYISLSLFLSAKMYYFIYNKLCYRNFGKSFRIEIKWRGFNAWRY